MTECKILKIVADVFLLLVIIAMSILLFTSVKDGEDISCGIALLILFGSFIAWAEMKIVPIMCEKMIETAENTKYIIEQNSKLIEQNNKKLELLNKTTTRTTKKAIKKEENK